MAEALAREQLLVGVQEHLFAALSLYEDETSVSDVTLLRDELAVALRYAERAVNARSVMDGDLPEDVLNVLATGDFHDEPLEPEDAADADATREQRTEDVTQSNEAMTGKSEAAMDRQAEIKADEDLRKEDAKERLQDDEDHADANERAEGEDSSTDASDSPTAQRKE